MTATRRLLILIFALVGLSVSAGTARAGWAAAVYSPSTGATGHAYDHATRAEAVAAASEYAGNPSDPVIVYVENGTCVIIADRRGGYGWGHADTLREAIAEAKKNCPGGTVRVWARSTP